MAYKKKSMALDIKTVIATLPQVGTVNFISIRPAKKADIEVLDEVEVKEGKGLVGDHYSGSSGKRQVTLIQAEHLQAVAGILGEAGIDPRLTRRNIVVSGINLLALKDRQFQIGTAILETTGPCEPCTRMEENFGPGGYNAMRGHGGICTRVIKGGVIRKGDHVKTLD